jgi:hypothetical protein
MYIHDFLSIYNIFILLIHLFITTYDVLKVNFKGKLILLFEEFQL